MNVGHTVPRGIIRNVLQREGIEPAPERGGRTPWPVFLKAHWRTLMAADFFTAEVWTVKGLITYYTKYSRPFRRLIAESGTAVIRLPPRSPNLNACAERFVRSFKDECLNRITWSAIIRVSKTN